MKMKKVSKTTKYKFNISRSVGVSSTYIFSIGDIKKRVKTALKNNGVKNSDEIIKRHEAEIIELQERINKTDAKFENYKKETDQLIADLKDELRVNKQTALLIGREMAKGFYDQSQKIRSKKKSTKDKQVLLCLSVEGDLYLESNKAKCYPMSKEKMREKLIKVLCSAKGYIKTAELAEMVGTTNQSIRNSKLEINRKANNQIDIPNLIVGRDGNGYRLNPKYKIKIL
jgi:NTP pyrophosphatase (non-canonical NTP hydrolase)